MKNEIMKKYYDDFLSNLNNEYSDYVYQSYKTDFQNRIEYGLKHLEKYAKAYNRKLISKSDYNNYRKQIEKFMFNE